MNQLRASQLRSSRLDEQTGLTLVELVVVALLVALLTSSLYGSLNGIIRTRDVTEKLRQADRTAHYIFGRIGLEIAGRSFVPLNKTKDEESESPPPTGATASYIRGTANQDGDYDSDSLRFVSANAAQSFIGSAGNAGVVEIEYRLEKAKDSSAGDKLPKRVLIREEIPANTADTDTQQKRRVLLPLSDEVVSLKFRYKKSGKWQSGWKETTPPLPEMLEMTVGIRGDNERVEFYRTAFPITQKRKEAQQN